LEDPDIIHLYSPEFFRGSLAAALAGQPVPVVFTLTDFITLCARYNLVRGDEQLCAGRATLAACLKCNTDDASRASSLIKRALTSLPTPLWGRLKQGGSGRLSLLAKSVLRAREYVEAQFVGWEPLTRVVSAIIAPSRTTLEIHHRHGWGQVPSFIIPWGMSKPSTEMLQRAPKPKGDLTIGFSGRVVAEKGLLELAQAVLVSVNAGVKCRLRVFCKLSDLARTAYGRKVLPIITRLGDCVECAEYDGTQAASIAEAMSSLDYLAVPSRWVENIPLVALEALAHGVPIFGAGTFLIARNSLLIQSMVGYFPPTTLVDLQIWRR
jgi:glycosyltransferase involved in cell wall biosynthesis